MLCDSALLGFCMVNIHPIPTKEPKLELDFQSYNPRTPPSDAVKKMTKGMEKACLSNIYHLTAAVSKQAVTNLNQLSQVYFSNEYETLPFAEFRPNTTVYFLSGGTRNEASGSVLKATGPTTGKPKSRQQADHAVSRSSNLFKLANWAVELYDYGVYIYILILLVWLNIVQMNSSNLGVNFSPPEEELHYSPFWVGTQILSILLKPLRRFIVSTGWRICQWTSTGRPSKLSFKQAPCQKIQYSKGHCLALR